MFKSVIGRDHAEFATNRQQDAHEFFMHLLTTIDRLEVRLIPNNFVVISNRPKYSWLLRV